ncbi:MAG: metallophosphoesterase [Pseudomonadota bacterium]
MSKSNSKKQKSLLKLIKTAFSDIVKCEKIDLKDSFRLPDKKTRFPLENYPLQLNIGLDAHTLHLYPEHSLDGQQKDLIEQDFILFDPEKYYSQICGFYRIKDEEKIMLGAGNAQQREFLNMPKKLHQRQLSIGNDEGKLIFKCHHPETGSCISPIFKGKKINKILEWRKKKVSRLASILGDPKKKLSDKEALKLINDVNHILEHEVYREKNIKGQPGGVLSIPDKLTVFIIGDLHTRLDNLLSLLTQNNFLEALEEGTACLIILGDAVHPEEEGKYDEMETSMLIMDMIFKLKVRFPKHVFYIRGNHDSFSEEISKRGVPQGLLWAKQLAKSRGKNYKKEMIRFYENIPYLAYSKNFITCHAAPPTSAVNLHALINIKNYPELMHDMVAKRLETPNRLSGYNKGDIKKLRKCLNVDDHTPFIVGHTPIDSDQTLWENVGGIPKHTIVYGGHPDWIGVVVQIGKTMYPMTYPVEPLIELVSEACKN